MKAREIIPCWPRGRSTSRSYWTSRDYLRTMYENYHGHKKCYLAKDQRWAEDEVGELAEERRKADMMEVWYEIERVMLRFEFVPDSYLRRHRRKHIRTLWDTTEAHG